MRPLHFILILFCFGCGVPLSERPQVKTVETQISVKNPTTRIIHLRDWHYVTRDTWAIEIRSLEGEVPDSEIDRRYEEVLQDVEKVQVEQKALIRALLREYPRLKIFQEGIVKGEYNLFTYRIEDLRDLRDRFTVMQEVVEKLERLENRTDQETADLVRGKSLLKEYHEDILRIGAVGQLMMDWELNGIYVAEDASLIHHANPKRGDEYRYDDGIDEAREDYMVQRMLKHEGTVLIILGGFHDLKNNVERLGGGKCELVRITTKEYARVNEE